MKELEHQLQVSCIKWFRIKFRNRLIYAIPNGGKRNIIIATKLKSEGVVSGIPDLHIPISNRFYHGLYIEMKVKPNTPTDNQEAVMNQLRLNGYKCEVCYSLNDFIRVVNEYMQNL